MPPTQEWPHSQQAFPVQISSETAHESVVTLKSTQQSIYFMKRLLKKERVEREREDTHMKLGKVKKSTSEVKPTKLNYHKGWRVATISVGAKKASPQNISGPWKRVLRSTFAGVGGGNQQHPFSPHIPNTLPAKQRPMQHFSARTE